jgi:hypothetical protein
MLERNNVYSCPVCNTTHTTSLRYISMLACRNCGKILATSSRSAHLKDSPVPEDWSYIQIGTTGKYNDASFQIVGQIRLQLRNEYKNFWSAEYGSGNCLWLEESFSSFIVFTSSLIDYPYEPEKLRANSPIPISSEIKLKGEFVEKCEVISFKGELGKWYAFDPKFFLIQASRGNQTASFFLESASNVKFMVGEKCTYEQLDLQNIIVWNEWE